jgi:eukaryotic-like serine/threonine-protein kinase
VVPTTVDAESTALLCYRCGSHVPDGSASCGTCGQSLSAGGIRHATGTFSRKKLKGLKVEGAPYSQGALIANRYLIKDTIGAGPHGYVFRAQDKEIDVEVAVKVVNPRLVQTPDERKIFSREIRLGRKLSHSHLVRIYEDGEDADRPYFTCQYLDGLPLRRIVDLRKDKGQFFTVREVEPIVAQIAQALEGAHKVGPHSDLRPENVIILPDILKLTDFGLGLAVPRQPFANALKQQHADSYLAPEYHAGGDVDSRIDVYSLGVLVGEMLAGVLPDGSVPSLREVNREVPDRVEAIYQRAVNPNPLARFSRAIDLSGELSEAARSLPPSRSALAKRSTVLPPSPPPITEDQRPKPPPPPPSTPPASKAPPPPPPGELRSEPISLKPRRPPPPPPEALSVPSNGASGHVEPAPAAAKPPPPPIEAFAKPREKSPPIEKSTPIKSDGVSSRRAVVMPRPMPKRRRSSRNAIWLVGLIVVGVSVGAGAGVLILDVWSRPTTPTPRPSAAPPPKVTETPQPEPEQHLAVTTPPPVATPQPPAPVVTPPTPEPHLAAATPPAQPPTPPTTPPDSVKGDLAKRADAVRVVAETMRETKNETKKKEEDRRKTETSKSRKGESKRAEAEKRPDSEKHAETEKASPPEPRADPNSAETDSTSSGDRKPLSGRAPVKVAVANPPPEKPEDEVALPPGRKTGSCPAGMKFVPSGSFRMGSSKDDPMMGFDEKPLATTETEGYCVDLFEYPNQRGVTPKVNVTYAQAENACKGKGKRLCTEEEWERACKGPGGASRYPYGSTFDADACNTRDADDADRSIAESGRFSRCRSGYGIADMSGNVAEWTGTRFGAGVTERTVKGGSYQRPDYDTRCAARKPTAPDTRDATLGFRCCADPK